MHVTNMSKGTIEKCNSCFMKKYHSSSTLAWSPNTHWMYNSEIKKIVLYLLLIFKSQSNRFSKTPKDVVYLIIKFVLFNLIGKIRQPAFCDVCTPLIYSNPPCEYCIANNEVAPMVFQNWIYIQVNNEFIGVPIECEICYKPLFVCELHKSTTIIKKCHKCLNPDKIQDAFKSDVWKMTLRKKTKVNKFRQVKNKRRWPPKKML